MAIGSSFFLRASSNSPLLGAEEVWDQGISHVVGGEQEGGSMGNIVPSGQDYPIARC